MATKISDTWLQDEVSDLIDVSQWKLASFNDGAVWQKREMISYYLIIALKYKVHPNKSINDLMHSSFVKQHSDNILTLNINDLKNNLNNTLISLADFCNINIDPNNLPLVNANWTQTQIFANLDQKIKHIVNCTVNNIYADWQPLHLVEESLIQYLLRLYGYEIKCYGLNTFPTNSKELKSYLYRPMSATATNDFLKILEQYDQNATTLDQSLEKIKQLMLELKNG
jgi:hypothetical protein